MMEYSPYDLLNIEGGRTTARLLKRQYKRLIRQFTPEHYPEQFMRIRNAYDSLVKGENSEVELYSDPPKHFPMYKSVNDFFNQRTETAADSDEITAVLTTFFETPFDTYQEVCGVLESDNPDF